MTPFMPFMVMKDGLELNHLKYNGYDIDTNSDLYQYRYVPLGRYR